MRRMLVTVLLLLCSCAALANESHPPVLRVGLSEVPPFVIHDSDGSWHGISVDLWRQVADKLGYRFELKPLPFQQLLPSLASGNLDVAVGALTMTADREITFDFTHPFFQTGLAIAVAPDAGVNKWTGLNVLFSRQFAYLVGSLAGLLLLVGTAVWLLERKRNAEQFDKSIAKGLGDGFWWAAVTMTTVGYGDKAPITASGRLIAILWMFSALIVVSVFTAAVTSALTVSHLQSSIQSPSDLNNGRIACVTNTISEQYLVNRGLHKASYADLSSAVEAVRQNKADALIYDLPILQYRNQQLPDGGLKILPGIFKPQSYGFALPNDSSLREPINRALLEVLNSAEWQRLKSQYLGPSA